MSENFLQARFLLSDERVTKVKGSRLIKYVRVRSNSQKHILALNARYVHEIEADACAVVVLVHHFDLIMDLRISKASTS